MILAILIYQMKMANCEYHLTAKWKSFVKQHIIDDDPYDEQTRERKEKDKDDSSR